jgi:signal transduction histidine kinase
VTAEAVYAFYIGAVALAGWAAGRRTAIGVVAACCLLAMWPRLIASELESAPLQPHGLRLASFVVVALLVAFLTGALRDARNQAEGASVAKDRFFAAISHEFRTPLNAVLAYADLLEEGVAGPITPQQRQFVQRMHAAGFHLLTLVEDIVDTAKMDAGRIAVRNGDVSLNDVIERAAGLVAPQAQIKGIRLRVEKAGEPILCQGDPQRIRQIVVNLLANAVKFTPPSGEVRVGSTVTRESDGARACVHVSDTGPGAQAMGGGISVMSQPGEGSTFTLWLRCRDRRSAARVSA